MLFMNKLHYMRYIVLHYFREPYIKLRYSVLR